MKHRIGDLGVSIFLRVVAIGLLAAEAACSISPSTKDVTGLQTSDIVRQVRCETREGLRDNIVNWLSRYSEGTPEHILADSIKAQGEHYLFSEDQFPLAALPIIKEFEDAAIAYNFSFDMTEVNNLDATFDFMDIVKKTIGSAAVTAGIDRSRERIQTFTVTDTFKTLLQMPLDFEKYYCVKYARAQNMTYPITGRVGVSNSITTFANLALFDNLGPSSDKSSRTFADTLTFTTKLAGSAAPKIVLVSGMGPRLADASINSTNSRTDVHKLILGFALPVISAPAGVATARMTKPGLFVTATGTPTELLAVQQIEQVIFRFELGRVSASPILNP
jgi:hypothetical protein